MKKTAKIILLILLLAFVLRLPDLDDPLFGDEIQWERFYCTGQYWLTDIGHPSLSGWLTNVSCSLFGVFPWAVRLPFLLVSLASIFLVYFYGRKLFSEKTALLASFFMAVSPWLAGIGIATNQDNYLMLFFTLGLLAYLCWLRKIEPEKNHIGILAVAAGLGLITKSAAVLLLGIICLHQLWLVASRQQKIRKSAELWPVCFGFLIPMVYYSFQFLSGATSYTSYTVTRTAIKLIWAGNYSFPAASWLMTFAIATPAFAVFVLLAAGRSKKHKAQNSLLWVWILVPAVVYSFLIINNNIERFMQVAAPAMALLAAQGVLQVVPEPAKFLKKSRTALAASAISVICLVLAYAVPQPGKYAVPYYSLKANLAVVFQPLAYFFPVISDMKPTYYLPVFFVIVSGILALVWLAVFLAGRTAGAKILQKTAVAALLAVFVASSGIIIAEQGFALKGPNIPKLAETMNNALIDYAGQNKSVFIIGTHQVDYPLRNLSTGGIFARVPGNLSELYLAVNATEAGSYTDPDSGVSIDKQSIILLRSEAEFTEIAEKALSSDIVVFEDYPPLPESNVLKKSLGQCSTIVRAGHRGIVFSMLSCS